MPLGTSLSATEQAKIRPYAECKISAPVIAKKLNRNVKAIRNYLKNPDNYLNKKRAGRKPKIRSRYKRNICILASNKNMSAAQIKHALSLDVTKRRVQQI